MNILKTVRDRGISSEFLTHRVYKSILCKGEKFQFSPVLAAILDFVEIVLSSTVFEIQAFLCFAIFAKNSKWPPFGRDNFFLKIVMATLQIPCGSKISSKSLYLARFSRYKHFCVLQFLRKIQNGRHFGREKNFLKYWDGHSGEIPCGSKILSKLLYLARFSRYKHFCVL